jgi:hypothetical protein
LRASVSSDRRAQDAVTTGAFQVMAMIQDQSGQEADAMSTVTVTGKVRPAHRSA